MKRHARIVATNTPVFAGNPADWALVRDPTPRPELRCPDCSTRLVAKLSPKRIPFFAYHRDAKECGHLESDGTGGGPETLEHRWMKRHVHELCQALGFESFEEYPLSRSASADVYVRDANTVIEVQRVRSNLPRRVLARQSSRQLWLFDSSPTHTKDVFVLPAVRYRIVDEHRRPARPWLTPTIPATFEVQVYATVLRARASIALSDDTFFQTAPVALRTFLEEVLAGRRRWHSDRTLHSHAGWILEADLAGHAAWTEARERLAARNALTVEPLVVETPPALPPEEPRVEPEPAVECVEPAPPKPLPEPPPPRPTVYVKSHGRRPRGAFRHWLARLVRRALGRHAS